jgi:hypothetical protein
MKRSIGFWAQSFILGLTLVLCGCLNSGGENTSPEPPNPPQVINAPPTANAGTDQVVAPGSTVSLNGNSSADSNGTIATYAWTQTGGAAVTIASSGTATPSFTAPTAAGALTFQLTVTDNGGASHSDAITVTVNGLPVANAGADQTVSAGAAVSLGGSATDADGTIASYAWTQTSGPAVTLSNANGATPTFIAPGAAASLAFDLTATDDRGATHVDSVSVTVTAIIDPPPPTTPLIGRHPENPISMEHGSAMLFVAASGEDLTYEWRRASGTVMKTGPEPFLLRTGLGMLDNGDCYYVVISNDAGIATSEQGCLTVEEIEGELDPSDDPASADDYEYAHAYGGTLMSIAQMVAGPLTGYTGSAMRVGVPMFAAPPRQCHQGSLGGTTIDGVLATSQALLPLGHHTITEAADNCYEDPDDETPQHGGVMVEYDFPETFGVGTLTIHSATPYFNGTVHATLVANNDGGLRSDDIEIAIADNFSSGYVKATSEQSITIDRRYASDNLRIDDVYLDFDASLTGYDEEGSVGTLFANQGGFFHLHQDFGGGDDGVPDFTSSGIIVVGLSTYILAALEPSGGHNGWSFGDVAEEGCPDGYVCVDPPTP